MTTYATARMKPSTPLHRRIRRLPKLPGAADISREIAAIAAEVGASDPHWRDALLLVATLLED